MTYKLFLDDEREPVDDSWVVLRSYDAATNYVLEHGLPSEISFDHDLGEGETGYAFAQFLVDYIIMNQINKDNLFTFYVHSQNPIGAENIRGLLNNLFKFLGKDND